MEAELRKLDVREFLPCLDPFHFSQGVFNAFGANMSFLAHLTPPRVIFGKAPTDTPTLLSCRKFADTLAFQITLGITTVR